MISYMAFMISVVIALAIVNYVAWAAGGARPRPNRSEYFPSAF